MIVEKPIENTSSVSLEENDYMKFIYVFSKDDRDILLKAGFTLLKEDIRNSIYVFDKSNSLTFALTEVSYIESDTLTF